MEWIPRKAGNGEKLQEIIWAYLLGYISDHGYAPTVMEIRDHVVSVIGVGITHQRVHQLLLELEKAERIRIEPKVWRGISIIE